MSASTRLAGPSNARLQLFVALFALYLLPLFVSFHSDFSSQDAAVAPLPYGGFQAPLLQWLGTLALLYALLRKLGGHLPMKMHLKTAAAHKNDTMQLMYFGVALAVMAGVSSRVESGQVEPFTGLTFLPLVAAYTVFYALLFEVLRPVKMTLSADMVRNAPALATFFASFAVIAGVLYGHVRLAVAQPPAFRDPFLLWMAAVGVFHGVLFAGGRLPGTAGPCFLHVHHWYWPLPLAHLAVFPTNMSMLAQAMFIGILVHGVACFGAEPLFYESHLMARRPSFFEWRLKPEVAELLKGACPEPALKTAAFTVEKSH